MAKAKRQRPLQVTILESSKDYAKGSGGFGKTIVTSRRTGKSKQKGWGAELNIKEPWIVYPDARDLARLIGNTVLTRHKDFLRQNRNPATGGSLSPKLEQRIKLGWRGITAPGKEGRKQWVRGLNYLYSNLRRTEVGDTNGKGGRYRGPKRCAMKIYFSPGDRQGYTTSSRDSSGGRTFPNPAASFNKLWDMQGQSQLSVGGKIDDLIAEATEEWMAMLLEGKLPDSQDSINEAFGRKSGPGFVKK